MSEDNLLAPSDKKYKSFAIHDADGKRTMTVSLPADELEGKDPEEMRHKALDFYKKSKLAEQTLKRDELQMLMGETEDIAKRVIPGAFAYHAAFFLASLVMGTYAERIQQPDWWDDEAFDRFRAATREALKQDFAKRPNLQDDLYNLVWREVIASALDRAEAEDVPDDIGALLDTYILADEGTLAQQFNEALSLHAQDEARKIFDSSNFREMPLADLETLFGFKPKGEAKDLAGKSNAKSTGSGTLTVEGEQEATPEADIFNRMLSVPSALPYSALQEAVATRDFQKVEGIPWPVARIDKKGARGTAQLRPAAMDEQPFMPPDEVEAWSKIMWRHREQMTTLDVDVMDALAAIYLKRTRNPSESAVADVDELLAMRGLKPKKGGSGTRGGYTPKQRAEIMAALSRIQSIWLDMAEMDVYEEGPKGGRKRSSKAVQSRPFVITDRMGQVRIDGYMDVERFIFKPGAVFAHYLHGPGRQTALLNAKILELDPYRQAWEKNIGRHLSNLWRIRARSGTYSDPLRVQTLLERTGYELTPRHGAWIRERFEKALDTLTEHGVINGWQYVRWNEKATERRDWFKEWLQVTVIIEPADEIEEHYQKIEQPNRATTKQVTAPSSEDVGPRMKARRKQSRLTQMQAAEQLGITQAYFSQLERGKAKPGAALVKKIEEWLGGI